MVRKMPQETLEKFFEKLERENKENNFKQTEIGLIPEDWEVVRLGDIIVYKKGKKPRMLSDKWEYGFLPYLTAEFFRTGKPDKFVNVRKEAGIEIVNPDDVVLIWDGSKAGDTFTGLKGVLASTMIKIDVRNEYKVSKKLIYYFLKTKFDILNTKTTGSTIPHVSKTVFENLPVPLPPLSEQRKIVRVLDKIQQAIELQDRIIEQAERLKKSLMQKLFTEGLYGEEQKETEIGLIPKSWEVVKLGEVTNIKTSTSSPTLIKEYITSRPTNSEIAKILYLKVADLNLPINTTYIIESKEIIYAPREVIDHFNVVPPFSIIFPKRGGAISTNKKRITRFYSLIDPNLAAVTPSKAINIIFLYYWFITFDLLTITDRSPIPQLNKKDIEQIRIPLPPLEEQKQIAHILSTIDKKIEIEQKRKQVLKALFKTMLHKLMSGEIRLKEVEI